MLNGVNARSTGLWHSWGMPDPNDLPLRQIDLALRQIDQIRTDLAHIESGQEFLMQRVNSLPSASDLWRAITLIELVAGVLGIVGIEAWWRYFPCNSNRPPTRRRRCCASSTRSLIATAIRSRRGSGPTARPNHPRCRVVPRGRRVPDSGAR
jgi:hypothetical protein